MRLITTNMEGELLKWTNYFSGWQPRWFILNNGVLSYYKSQEDVSNGCKGSVKMAVCDIAVHPTDMTRLDLTIPGEQHYYVKTSTPQDRQSWLIALGSSKAAYTEFTSSAKKSGDVPDTIRTKQSELRLYCDLLMQQVHSVKQMASRSDGILNVEKLTESTSLIVATCDTFIVTLDDCMKLVSNTPVLESTHHHVLDAAVPISPSFTSVERLHTTRPVLAGTVEKPASRRPSSLSSMDGIRVHTSSHHLHNGGTSPKQPESSLIQQPVLSHPSVLGEFMQSSSVPPVANSHLPPSLHPSPQVTAAHSPMTNTVNGLIHQQYQSNGDLPNGIPEEMNLAEISPTTSSDLENLDDLRGIIDEDIETFFSTMQTSFADVDTSHKESILVIPFLEACKNLVPIFDKLNTTALTPVKMDFCGNIRKIEQKFGSSSALTLQDMVLNEVKNNQHTHSDSATSALLWLKRSLEFITEFLKECCTECTDMGICAGNAYSRTLKHYHGWIVRGIFSVAVRALPYRETFISHLSTGDIIDTTSQHFEQALLKHIKIFVSHLSRVLGVINDFYIRHSLDCSDTV